MVSDVALGASMRDDASLGDADRGEEARGEKTLLLRGAPEEGPSNLFLGVPLREPSRGVNGRDPALGVNGRSPVLGVILLLPVRGVKLRVPVRGVRLRAPDRGAALRSPVRGVKLLELLLGPPLREGVRGDADLGPLLKPSLGPLLKPSRGLLTRGRNGEDGRVLSLPAGPSVRFTNFDSVEDAGFALCTRGRSPIGFALSAGRRVGADVDAVRRTGRADGLPLDRLMSRRGAGIVVW